MAPFWVEADMAGGIDGSRMLLAAGGGEERKRLLVGLFSRQRARLRALVELRLDPRLRGLIDPAAFLDDLLLEAERRLEDYLRAPRIPFFLWLHSIAAHRLRDLHRLRLGALEVPKEICLGISVLPEASPAALAERLVEKEAGPAESIEEAAGRVRRVLEAMGPIDREILALKGIERLTNAEAALVLGLGERAVNGRHLGALRKVKEVLGTSEGTTTGAAAG